MGGAEIQEHTFNPGKIMKLYKCTDKNTYNLNVHSKVATVIHNQKEDMIPKHRDLNHAIFISSFTVKLYEIPSHRQ